MGKTNTFNSLSFLNFSKIHYKALARLCVFSILILLFKGELLAQCVPGQYWDGTKCVNCPAGQFTTTGSALRCSNCPLGQYNTQAGSTSCTLCPAGSYTGPIPGASSCTTCPAGQYSPISGSTSCSNCLAGTYSAAGATNCTTCASGTYSSNIASSVCYDCPAGTFALSPGSTSCINCPAGQFSPSDGAILCQDCPKGTYSPLSSSTSCQDCPAGRYAAYVRSTYCEFCQAGKYSASGASICTDCPAGTFSSLGASGCTDCPVGQFALLSGSPNCTDCTRGTFAPHTGSIICGDCPKGTYADHEGSTACTNCPVGKTTKFSRALDISYCDVTLPIELLDFTVAIDKSIVRLRWRTAQEVNTSFYVIQKTTDLNDWTTIARTNGKGTYSGISTYDAVDPFPAKGITYYRIKEVDFDGTMQYSPVVSAEMIEKTRIKVYPNPVGANLNIAHGEEIIKSVSVYNTLGQLMMDFTFEKTNIGVIDMSGLLQGQYTLLIYTDGGFYSERVYKFH